MKPVTLSDLNRHIHGPTRAPSNGAHRGSNPALMNSAKALSLASRVMRDDGREIRLDQSAIDLSRVTNRNNHAAWSQSVIDPRRSPARNVSPVQPPTSVQANPAPFDSASITDAELERQLADISRVNESQSAANPASSAPSDSEADSSAPSHAVSWTQASDEAFDNAMQRAASSPAPSFPAGKPSPQSTSDAMQARVPGGHDIFDRMARAQSRGVVIDMGAHDITETLDTIERELLASQTAKNRSSRAPITSAAPQSHATDHRMDDIDMVSQFALMELPPHCTPSQVSQPTTTPPTAKADPIDVPLTPRKPGSNPADSVDPVAPTESGSPAPVQS